MSGADRTRKSKRVFNGNLGPWGRYWQTEKGRWGWGCNLCRYGDGGFEAKDEALAWWRAHETQARHQRLSQRMADNRKYFKWARTVQR